MVSLPASALALALCCGGGVMWQLCVAADSSTRRVAQGCPPQPRGSCLRVRRLRG
jgi:hypothetical protein